MAATLSIAFTATPLAANTKVAIFASRPLSAGIDFVPDKKLKHITTSSAAAASPIDILSAYQAKYGVQPLAGQKIYVKMVVINSSGLANAATTKLATAT